MNLRQLRFIAAICCLLPLALSAQNPSTPAANPTVTSWNILQEAAKNSSWEKRQKAVQVLGLLNGNRQAEDIALAALKDSRSEVRAAAADTLGDIGAKNATPQLVDAFKDKDIAVVLAAARSLVKMGDKRGYEVYYAILTGELKSGKGLLDEQKKMLKDPNALAQFGFEQGIGFIPFASLGYNAFKMVRKDDTSPILAASALMLANDPDPKTGEALANAAATDKSWIVRAAALNAIAKRGDPALKQAAIGQLQDSKEEVQYSAAAAVIRLSEVPERKAVRGHKPPPRK